MARIYAWCVIFEATSLSSRIGGSCLPLVSVLEACKPAGVWDRWRDWPDLLKSLSLAHHSTWNSSIS